MKTLITSTSLAFAVSLLSPSAFADKTPTMQAEDVCSAIDTFVTDLRRLPSDDMIQGTNLEASLKDKITSISHDATDAYLDQLKKPVFLMDNILEENQDDPELVSYMENQSCPSYHYMRTEYEKWGDNVPSHRFLNTIQT